MESKALEGLSAIAHYIEEMEFKKKPLGGFSEEDVMEKIGIICGKYEDLIRELCEKQKQMEDSAQKMQDEYQKKSTGLLQSIEQIQEYREHAVTKADEEAARILEETQKRAEEEEKKIAALEERYTRALLEYKKKTDRLKEEGEAFSEKAREILKQIEDLSNGNE